MFILFSEEIFFINNCVLFKEFLNGVPKFFVIIKYNIEAQK